MQRTDCRGGGEGLSTALNKRSCLEKAGFATISSARGAIAGSETPDALRCRFVTGTPGWQHEPLGGDAARVPLLFVFTWSQVRAVAGVEHSARRPEDSAHAERGTGPSPARLNITPKMSALFTRPIVYQSVPFPPDERAAGIADDSPVYVGRERRSVTCVTPGGVLLGESNTLPPGNVFIP